MALKWTKEEPGHYVSGDWHVKGSGTSWDLYKKKTHVHGPCKSKKECQQVAEDPSFATPEPEPKNPQNTGFNSKGPASLDDLDGVMRSLYLEVTHLTTSIAQQAHYEKQLSESIDKLTKAMLVLGKHIANLDNKKSCK